MSLSGAWMGAGRSVGRHPCRALVLVKHGKLQISMAAEDSSVRHWYVPAFFYFLRSKVSKPKKYIAKSRGNIENQVYTYVRGKNIRTFCRVLLAYVRTHTTINDPREGQARRTETIEGARITHRYSKLGSISPPQTVTEHRGVKHVSTQQYVYLVPGTP